MQKINVGFPIELSKLIETRMLIQANSGGGKSYLMRKIIEEVHGKVPFIVLDLEGEFISIREKYDVIIFGKGHDIPINIQYADKVARYLLELNASAIIDLSELKHHERILFVRRFLESMIDAPKGLWHPTLVFLDEAHIFCPEDSKAESTAAVIDLCTRGRKRGYCAVLATQRISKLKKDAVAELNNKIIGRTGMDVDVKRTAFELGMNNNDAQRLLPQLQEGEFYVFGPAISREVKKQKISKVCTTHVKTGMKFTKLTPPSNAIQKLIGKISEIPKEVEKEKDTIKNLQEENKQLKQQVKSVSKVQPVDQSEVIELKKQLIETKKKINEYESWGETALKSIGILSNNFPSEFIPPVFKQPILKKQVSIPSVIHRPIHNAESSNGSLGKCERNILIALAQRAKPSTKNQIGILAGYAITSGSFNNSLSKLRTSGFVSGNGSIIITEHGLSALGHYDPLPEGEELQRYWLSELGKAESAILKVLIDNFPNEITKEQIAEACGYAVTSGSFNNSLSKLRTLELAEGRKEIKACESLF